VYTINPDGSDLKRLTNSPWNDAHNAWSPDGQWIAFASGRGGFKDEAALYPGNPQAYGEIYVMRADGSDQRVLTDDQFENGIPTWIHAPPRAVETASGCRVGHCKPRFQLPASALTHQAMMAHKDRR
jgi:TolB protein